MADILFERLGLIEGVVHIAWNNIGAGDTCGAFQLKEHTDKQIQVWGVFSGATIGFQGSCDPRARPDHVDHLNAEWFDMTDKRDAEVSMNQSGGELISDIAFYVRPTITGGDINTDLNFVLFARKN